MPIMGVARFERFFRIAAGLDVDKADLRRYSVFVNHKIYDLLLRGQAAAKANGRDIIEIFDLPITKGLQERVHEFRKLGEAIAIEPILERLMALPPFDFAYSDETKARLPRHRGRYQRGICAHLQDHRSGRENPGSKEWERSQRIFDLLL